MSTTNVKENPKPNYEIPGSQLYVSRPGLLAKLLLQNRISLSKVWLLFKIIFFSILSYPLQLLQRIVLFFSLRNFDLNQSPPVFILGHWRSGTTHVHYTLALDKQFAYLTNFQSFFFNICMLGLGWLDKFLAPLTPKKRPQDNMEFSVFKPQEEENVISNFSVAAGVHSFYFPKNRSYFYKFNLFRGISKREKRIWQRDYDFTLKALAKMSDSKKLLLKNPNNTGRIKQLLELYPDAKFVYIHRNPYQVYLSTKHLHRTVLRGQRLQEISNEEEDAIILDNYHQIMQQYLQTRALIPNGNLVELSYDEIGSENEIDRYQQIYDQFKLDGWDTMKDKIETYLASKSSYKKNKFIPIDDHLVDQIKSKWGFVFEEFGYEKRYMAEMASDN